MAIVLGINSFHAGASAVIIVDGEIVFAIAEERLNRVKYFAGFPKLAIKACLDHAGIGIGDVDHVAVGRDSQANRAQKLAFVLKNTLKLPQFLKMKASRSGLADLTSLIASECDFSLEDLRFQQHNVEHHLAHTASAYYTSGWDHAAGITIDGSGDFVTCMMSECKGRTIEPVHRIFIPNSVGFFYSAICQFIGYEKYGDEGKVMGLAPLGKDTYWDLFADMVRFENGEIKLGKKYFKPFGQDSGISITDKGIMEVKLLYSDYFCERMGKPRVRHSEITQRDKDLAFGVQKRFEDIYFEMLNHLHLLVPSTRVVMAGGCALNSVANGKIFFKTPFQETCIQPAAGDDGLALGAALHVAHSVLEEGENRAPKNVYYGGGYDDGEIQAALDSNKISYDKCDRDTLIRETVGEIKKGAVVGWFQGRSEWGPRALGNRSILCHPGLPDMKDVLNSRIKKRESFRPFAPTILKEELGNVFEHDYPSPFMLHVYGTREEWRERLTAVNHLDNTGRLQSVTEEQNPLYYSLIKEFHRETGIPVLLNTSFNENEPIVETYGEAIDCFLRTKMDVLVIGPFVCRKTES